MPYKDSKKQKESQRKYYLANKEKARENVRRRRKEYKEWYRDLKSQMKCEECSENHISTLDFHHKDGNSKEDRVSQMVMQLFPKKRILAEIDKCIVLCANCHRKLHWNEIDRS